MDLIGDQEIMYQIIFGIEMEFTRKAWFGTNGATTEMPSSLTYFSFVARDSIKLTFLIPALNDLK